MNAYDLGGIGQHTGYVTVNAVRPCDLLADIINLDSICGDGAADEFYLSHTLEHVPAERYRKFLEDLHRKLKSGGLLRVVQTDVARLLRLWIEGRLSFRAARCCIFTPLERLRQNPLNLHLSMSSAEELQRDLQVVGFETTAFDAGHWAFDLVDDMLPDECRSFFGVPIPNLGVVARKP